MWKKYVFAGEGGSSGAANIIAGMINPLTSNPQVGGSNPPGGVGIRASITAFVGRENTAHVTPKVTPFLTRNRVTLAILAACVLMLIARPVSASAALMSWYGPGFYGQRTACGKILTNSSVWVAALKPHLARCGMRLTVYTLDGRRYHVRVQDRGAWRSDHRLLDAAPGLRARIGFYGVTPIRIRRGWQ